MYVGWLLLRFKRFLQVPSFPPNTKSIWPDGGSTWKPVKADLASSTKILIHFNLKAELSCICMVFNTACQSEACSKIFQEQWIRFHSYIFIVARVQFWQIGETGILNIISPPDVRINLKKWKQSIPLSNNDNKSNSNNSNGNGNNDDDDNNLYLHMIKIWAIQLVGLCYKMKKLNQNKLTINIYNTMSYLINIQMCNENNNCVQLIILFYP